MPLLRITNPQQLDSGFREKDHVHFSDGTALNKDGTWKHIKNKTHKFTNEEKKYLKENGWKIPE